MKLSTDIWVWVMAASILSIWSFVYKRDNIAFRVVQAGFLGSSIGFGLGNGVVNIVDQNLAPIARGELIMLIPLFFGICLYTRLFPKVDWLSRLSMGFWVGVGTSTSTFGIVNGQLLAQIRAGMLSFAVRAEDGSVIVPHTINNWLMILGTLSVCAYFLFSLKPTKGTKAVTTIGRYVMMVSFGTVFGTTINNRITAIMTAMSKLVYTWLGVGS